MATRNLSTESMLALSLTWTDPERDRPALEASVAAPLLPKLDEAHADLMATASPPEVAEAERELGELQTKGAELDRVHDRKARGTYYVLTGLAELADDHEVAASRLALRDSLMPAGLAAATQRTYLEEAGDAAVLPHRLDDGQHNELGEIAVGDGRTLADEVDAWTSTARQLGELEGKRAELVAKRSSSAPERPSSASARNQWIRVVKAIAQAIALDDVIAPRLDEAFVTPLRLAEAKADRKARGARAAGGEGEPAGGEAGGPAGDEGAAV
jgi:hypothetical protein